MKLITCVGYTCSGSSSINNFFREFENVCDLTPHNECRFLQDPDGIADLEYNLFENRHRLNSEYAIKRYRAYTNKYDKRNFKQIFGNGWVDINNRYIENLIQFKYNSYWHADIRDFTMLMKIKYYFHRASRILLNKILPSKYKIIECKNYFPNLQMSLPINSNAEFIEITQEFCENLFNNLNKDNKEFGIVDQLVPPRNIDKYVRFVKDLKVIVVDRDPRDVYIETVGNKDRAFPDDVEMFCKVYRDNREGKIENTNNILQVRFEDLVYKYDETTKIIEDFVGEDEKFHTQKKCFFSVEKSKQNTKLWEKSKNEKYSNQIKYITNNLKEYLYDYN